MRTLLLMGLLGLAACKEESTVAVDFDGDGILAASDCDDRRAEVGPEQPELCDGLDNDCDGLIDEAEAEDATLWYLDYDRDGFGGTVSQRSCAGPTGWITTGGDCDDTDARVAPGVAFLEPADGCQRDSDGDGWADAAAESPLVAGTDCDDSDPGVAPDQDEVCDGVDTDCDGELGAEELDLDADTYLVCTVVVARAAVRGDDCDDTDPAISPGATEICNEGEEVDDDCNGVAGDAGAAALELTGQLFYRDSDGDGAGALPGERLACSAPAGFADNADDCDDSRATVYPGAPEQCDGLANDCDGEGTADLGLDPCPSRLSGTVTLTARVEGADEDSCAGAMAITGVVTEARCPDCSFALAVSHGGPSWEEPIGNCDEIGGFGTVTLGFVPGGGVDDQWLRYEDGAWVEAYTGTAGGGSYSWWGERAVESSDYSGGPVTYEISGSAEAD